MDNEPLYILKKYWGYDRFRDSQEPVIQSVLEGNDTLALLPTGGGKSITFQVPAMMKDGICVVISPLVALMTDQVAALKNREIRAISLAGGLAYTELERLLNNALYGQYKFLYMSPERLQQELVRNYLKQMTINLLVIDEAHCVSHWGKDFRPSYLQCKWLKENFPTIPLLALTASATPPVQKDIVQFLAMKSPKVIHFSLARPNIAYRVYKDNDKYSSLLYLLKKTEGSAIVYLNSRNGCVQMAEMLEQKGLSATYFHGALGAEEKNQKLSMWLLNDVRIMVATNAFGMGIDKPDVRIVVHWNIPQTLEDYFQEAGRAGRDGQRAEAILLYSDNDLLTSQKLLKEYLIDIPFLKLLYAKLNSYFCIAWGEGEGTVHSFLFPDFCNRYQLSPLKTYNGLQALDRLSIIQFNQQFFNKITLHITASSQQLLEYLYSHRYLKDIVIYLIRSYPLIYSQPTHLEIEKIIEQTEQNYYEIVRHLEQLHKDGMAIFRNEKADVQLVFNVPRDDDRTINGIAKDLKNYNQTKEHLQEAVYTYLNDKNTCRSVQLLRYFGEESTSNCGICSNCKAHFTEKVDKKAVKEAVWQCLQHTPLSPSELLLALPYPPEAIEEVLNEFLTMEKLHFDICNRLCLN